MIKRQSNDDGSEAKKRALEYLCTQHVLTLATHGKGGVWSAALYYVNVDFKLIFLSAPSTRHVKNLVGNSHVAVSINENNIEWTTIRGLQFEAEVEQITDPSEIAEVQVCYANRFPVIGSQAPAEITKALSRVNWYVCNPTLMYFIDNSLGLGHRDRIILD